MQFKEAIVVDFDLNHALCVYLGGDPASGEIQIGMRNERLQAAFGPHAPDVKSQLDRVLEVAVERNARGMAHQQSIASWLAVEVPTLSDICRRKIEAHVLYLVQH